MAKILSVQYNVGVSESFLQIMRKACLLQVDCIPLDDSIVMLEIVSVRATYIRDTATIRFLLDI